MQEFITIEKDPELNSSQDYKALREMGLKHIESLSSAFWTDYNEHDPGITLLEVLAYAITDLGYRTGHDVKDLLTAEQEAFNNHQDTFHKATEILPCNQVTELDLREILIDIKGVRNAWIKIAETFENDYYVDYDESVLSMTDPASSTTEELVTNLNGLYHIIVEFDRLVIPMDQDLADRLTQEQGVLEEARAKLLEYRNFCEDYFIDDVHELSGTPSRKVIEKPKGFEKIVLWADIEVYPDSEMEKVHAQVYFDVEQFLIPYVSFFSMKERIDAGKTVDEIFEGPLLAHGFIDEEELEDITLFERIHTSDLYQVIMDVPGVKAIKTLKVANYLSDDGIAHNSDATIEDTNGDLDLSKLLTERGEEWCLELSSDMDTCTFYELLLATVTTEASDAINKTVKFYTGENSVPVSLDTAKTLDELNILRQNDRKRRERLDQMSFELEVPEGDYQEVNNYFPVQNELPLVYGTGLDGLAEEETEERKAQAKQLKAFMLFFEQLLTNYLAQLHNVRFLFSWDESIDKTYYTQLLEDVKDRGLLYVEEYDSSPLSPAGILDESALKDLIQKDTESSEVFFDRRSRFLNHLIARFNEKFVEYSTIMHSINLEDRLLTDKAKFLRDYDLISMNRGKGFDYSALRPVTSTFEDVATYPDVWDTKNVTGYQHRISRFLGYCDESRRFLYSGHDMRIEQIQVNIDPTVALEYRYVLTIDADTGLEIYGDQHPTSDDAITQFNELIENEGKGNVTNFSHPTQHWFRIDSTVPVAPLGNSKVYASAAERDAALALVDAYFLDVITFETDFYEDGGTNLWHYTVKVSSAVPPFFINGIGQPTLPEAETALDDFLNAVNNDTVGFSLPALGQISNNEYYFQVTDGGGGGVIAISDFAGSREDSGAWMLLAQEFFSNAIGYLNSEAGIHVVEHILLRPKTDNYSLLAVDVKQYDSIETEENPPVAYPFDYDGVYKLSDNDTGEALYDQQYYLCEEVDLSSPNIDPIGLSVNIVEPYVYTLSENQVDLSDLDFVAGTSVTWKDFMDELDNISPVNYDLSPLGGENSVDHIIWGNLLDDGLGCNYDNYIFGTISVPWLNGAGNPENTNFNYYFIIDGTTILAGLASSQLSSEEVKERGLRAFAYFCDNTTCKGVANPYEFRATVILPGWADRSKDYNYREFSEEIIRLEAPAHVAMDIKWVNRTQMKEFELCYHDWLVAQGLYVELDRQLKFDDAINEELVISSIIPNSGEYDWLLANTNISEAYNEMVEHGNCVIEKLNNLVDIYQSKYKTVVRNDQYFTGDSTTNGYVMAWVSDAADGSVLELAEIISGELPAFLGFYTGQAMEPGLGLVDPMETFDPGDFVVIDNTAVEAGIWSFTVKTYSDTGQVSCTDVTIEIIPDLESFYTIYPECYTHLNIGDILSDIHDPNGLVFSALLQGGTLPPYLKLLENHGDVMLWAASHSLDETLYQPGDIVVDAVVPTSVNDTAAVGPPADFTAALTIKITDITGGITVLSGSSQMDDPYNPGTPILGAFPIVLVYGNAQLIQTKGTCPPVPVSLGYAHVATFDLTNPIYPNPDDTLLEFADGHESEGVLLSTYSLLAIPGSGIAARLTTDGRVQVYVAVYGDFKLYVEGLTPDAQGVVTIPVTQLAVTDTCGFSNTWAGNICVKQDIEATALEDITSCAGKYGTSPAIVTITDPQDGGLFSYVLSAGVQSDLAAMGITHQLVSVGNPVKKELVFNVSSASLFLSEVENVNIFNSTEVVNGLEVNVYEFDVETYDIYGGYSLVSTKIYGPVNKPFECLKEFPDGTSYLAYLYNVPDYNPILKYIPSTSGIGKTVMSFEDDNGIESISCSCVDCNGNPFPVANHPWMANSKNKFIIEETQYGVDVEFSGANKNQAPEQAPKAKGGKQPSSNKPKVSEKPGKVGGPIAGSPEEYLVGYVNEIGYPYSPFVPPTPNCDCLTSKGLSLDTSNNRIYVSNAKLFAEKAVGTTKFSIHVVDGCGITSCKEVSLVISDDKESYYLDVKNKSFLNTLNGGDILAYPEDPDGQITRASLILYNPDSEEMAMPELAYTLIPPGTAFNKKTGEIKVLETIPSVMEYVGNENVQKSKQELEAGFEKKAPNEAGHSVFEKSGASEKRAGTANRKSDWALQNEDVKIEPAKAKSSRYDRSWVKESPWIEHKGNLTSGKWTIYVLTKDIFGGLSIAKCVIIIKKNRVIKGVGESAGTRDGYAGVKNNLKDNYSNILVKSVDVDIESSQVQIENEVIQGLEIEGLNQINSSKARKL